MDEDKTQKKINKGQRAQSLLDNQAFQEATGTLKTQLIERWQLAVDPNERERIWTAVNLIEQIKNTLSATATNGRHAKRELDELAKGKPRQFGVV